MINSGIVKTSNKQFTLISVYKDNSCSNCEACSESSKISNDIRIKSREDLKVGDEISFYIDDKKILSLALLIYIFPIFMLFFMYFIASFLNLKEFLKIFLSFVGLGLSFFIIYIYDKFKGKDIEEKILIQKIKRKSS